MFTKINCDIRLNVNHCIVMKRLSILPTEGLIFSKKKKLLFTHVWCLPANTAQRMKRKILNLCKQYEKKLKSNVMRKNVIGENNHEVFNSQC